MQISINTVKSVANTIAKGAKPVANSASSIASKATAAAHNVNVKAGTKEYVEFFKKLLGSAKDWGKAAFEFVKKHGETVWNFVKGTVARIADIFKKAPKTV